MKKLFMRCAPPIAVILGLSMLTLMLIACIFAGDWIRTGIVLGGFALLAFALWPLRRPILELLK